MKKTWVKREQIYYKPFYKSKSKMLLLGIFVLAIIFFAYQVLSINQLPNTSTPWSLESTFYGTRQLLPKQFEDDSGGGGGGGKYPVASEERIRIIRGIRLFDYDAYKPNFEGNFKCLDGSAVIPFERVNDDYCDCPADGSDEPSTNACADNGRFYCRFQKRHITGRGRDTFVPSSRINDGICDCCDGSDEWSTTTTTDCVNKCK